jgi:hypothetical protein
VSTCRRHRKGIRHALRGADRAQVVIEPHWAARLDESPLPVWHRPAPRVIEGAAVEVLPETRRLK